jgi:hypothetical protein
MNSYAEAKEALQKILRQLARINPSAARGRAGRNTDRASLGVGAVPPSRDHFFSKHQFGNRRDSMAGTQELAKTAIAYTRTATDPAA